MKNIKAVNINFRPSSSVRPNLSSTRADEKIEFLDLDAPKKKKTEGNPDDGGGENPGGNENPGGGGDNGGETPDPAPAA